jgi:2-phospho-L-lactate guanylyltransferase
VSTWHAACWSSRRPTRSTMPVAGIIPCKPYREAKTRLAACLPPLKRAELSRLLLLRTVRLACELLDRVVVVSRDSDLLDESRHEGAIPLVEEGSGLNSALTQAARFACAADSDGVMVLPADLPLLTVHDIQSILHHASASPCVVIAPCRHETGTNALLVRPPLLIPFAFGAGSFARHVAAASAAGVEPIIERSATLAFDLDTPADWQLVCDQIDL